MNYILSKVYPNFDTVVLSDFDKALMVILTVIACVLSILGLAYIVKYIIFQVYLKCSNAKVQEAVRGIIYELDKVADEMSNKEKRKEAIRSVHDLFIWRTIPIPAFVIGIIIDLEVAAIRSLQKQIENEKDPYLHEDESEEEHTEEKVKEVSSEEPKTSDTK